MEEEFKDYVKNNCLLVWPDAYPDDRILDFGLDNFPDISEERAAELIGECRAEITEVQAEWPATTECDMLDQAAVSLDSANILFLQHLDTTPSSCWSEVISALSAKPDGNRYIGAAFYHFQSTERALEYQKMHINFGVTEKGKFLADENFQFYALTKS